jgi:hypothetical protein
VCVVVPVRVKEWVSIHLWMEGGNLKDERFKEVEGDRMT